MTVKWARSGVINTVSTKTTETINGETCPVWKVEIPNLSELVPPRALGGSYQDRAVVIDGDGNEGNFIVVAANPSGSPSGSMAANEAWLASWEFSNWSLEFHSAEQAVPRTQVKTPAPGLIIGFDSIQGQNPAIANSIQPEGATGGCVSATLRQIALDNISDIIKLKQAVDAVGGFDIGNLLTDNRSVLAGLELSSSADFQITASAGETLFKGIKYDIDDNLTTTLVDQKTLSHIVAQSTDGTPSIATLQEASTAAAQLDIDYNPGADLPTVGSPAWTGYGSASGESVSGNIYTLPVTAEQRYFQRDGLLAPASGGGYKAKLRVTDGELKFILDLGAGANYKDFVAITKDSIQLASTGQIEYIQGDQFFDLMFFAKDSESYVYINGQLVLTSTELLSGESNKFQWGFMEFTTGSAEILRVENYAGILMAPQFASYAGVKIGSVMTSVAGDSPTIWFQGTDRDLQLGIRKEGYIPVESELPKKERLDLRYKRPECYCTYLDATTFTVDAMEVPNQEETKLLSIEDEHTIDTTAAGVGGILQSSDLSGTITATISTETVTGSGTNFSAGVFNGTIDATTVKATSTLAGYPAPAAVDPTSSMLGASIGTSWISNSVVTEQKFNVDIGSAIALETLFLVNHHNLGANVSRGVKNFELYGTNSGTAFNSTTYSDLTDLTLLGTYEARIHLPEDGHDGEYFHVGATAEYRYYVLRFADNWGDATFMGIRRVEFHEALTDDNFRVGEVVTTAGGQSRRVRAVISDTELSVEGTFDSTEAGVAYKRGGIAPVMIYHLYALKNGSTEGFFLSTESYINRGYIRHLPAGVSIEDIRQLPFWINTSGGLSPGLNPGDILPFVHLPGDRIRFPGFQGFLLNPSFPGDYTIGNVASAVAVPISARNLVPEYSVYPYLRLLIENNTVASYANTNLGPLGDFVNYRNYRTQGDNSKRQDCHEEMLTSKHQFLQAESTTASTVLIVAVVGSEVTDKRLKL